jgi:hypothetical protein
VKAAAFTDAEFADFRRSGAAAGNAFRLRLRLEGAREVFGPSNLVIRWGAQVLVRQMAELCQLADARSFRAGAIQVVGHIDQLNADLPARRPSEMPGDAR